MSVTSKEKIKIKDPVLVKWLRDQAATEHRTTSNMVAHILHLHKEACDLKEDQFNRLQFVGR